MGANKKRISKDVPRSTIPIGKNIKIMRDWLHYNKFFLFLVQVDRRDSTPIPCFKAYVLPVNDGPKKENKNISRANSSTTTLLRLNFLLNVGSTRTALLPKAYE